MRVATPDPVFDLVHDAVHELVARVLSEDESDIDAAALETALRISGQVQEMFDLEC